MANTLTLDFDARYSVEGMEGIAFYLRRYDMDLVWSDDLGEYEEVVDEDTVVAVMVGDDREHLIPVTDLHEIADEDYCAGCGQIGCGWC